MGRRILLVDNDPSHLLAEAEALRDEGFFVEIAPSAETCLKRLASSRFHGVVIDLMMPHGPGFTPAETRGGMATGVALGRAIRRKYPRLQLASISINPSLDSGGWFDRHGHGVWQKPLPTASFVRRVKRMFQKTGLSGIKSFIVHGRADKERGELQTLLRRDLRMPMPIVLQDQPDCGRTVIEKFEDYASDVDLVFVLLTPDDAGSFRGERGTVRWRARQNVIFELGYFYGKLQRRSGRVIFLYMGPLEIPSDLAGMVYLDVTAGIRASAAAIRSAIDAALR
jgi:CheY-like chemotaxis protein